MKREFIAQYSQCLQRGMHLLVYGHDGVPVLAFPCQDGMCNNWESFDMPNTLSDSIESGRIQLFCVDTVDTESWSDTYGDPAHRAWVQEQYYHYIVDEVVPLIHSMNPTHYLPLVTGFSLGATHAAIVFFRRPDLFAGLLGQSGCYSAQFFWNGWCNDLVYNNSPLDFLPNMPADHPYIELYNQRKIILCVGQGRWEGECLSTTRAMREVLAAKGIHAWVDLWGYDVDHDWPWWKKQILYFLPYLLDN